jgi:hypothetical protein
MAPPFDKPALAAGMDWLASLEREIDATTPAEWAKLERHDERIKHELDEIDAGRHPLCLAKPVA